MPILLEPAVGTVLRVRYPGENRWYVYQRRPSVIDPSCIGWYLDGDERENSWASVTLDAERIEVASWPVVLT